MESFRNVSLDRLDIETSAAKPRTNDAYGNA
jgi:hypothetical protein